jgi:FkbM family methyltransferase
MTKLRGLTMAGLRRRLGFRPRVLDQTMLGRPVHTIEGTFGGPVDYDDAWILACTLHSSIVFDIGANQGDMAMLALLSPNVEHVVLIEPNPEALVIASSNIVRSQLSAKARFICAFASDSDDAVVKLWTVGSGAAGSLYSSHAKTAASAGSSIDVSTVTLDTLVDSLGLVPDFVKIDVEGAEGMVLAGAKRCAALQKTRFLVEMHSNAELPMAENANRILAWCAEQKYQAWYLAEGVPLRSSDAVRTRGRCHFLLQPASWPYPSWLEGVPQSAGLESVWSRASRPKVSSSEE